MLTPSFSFLKAMEEGFPYRTAYSGATFMHHDYRLYKYLWRVFWKGSPCEGDEFLHSPPLSTKAAFDLIEQIERNGECCLVSNERRPRLGVAMWDLENRRWKGQVFAPAYDDDPDLPTSFGHK